MRPVFLCLLILLCVLSAVAASGQTPSLDSVIHNQSVLDAHNCYPYEGQWSDRIDRILKQRAAGFPVAIEQDIAWAADKATGKSRPVVTHKRETTGDEPALRDYFFERVRPIVEQALRDNDRAHWPLIVLHFDFKDNQPAVLHAVWDLLGEYESWITTAPQTASPGQLAPFRVGPLLVLTEDSDAQEEVFFKEVPLGKNLRLFGSAHTAAAPAGSSRQERTRFAATAAPEVLLAENPTNYRRWWNNSWAEVEEGGQTRAGDWTPADDLRLGALVDHAHKLGFWIRFYTLDGFSRSQSKGWDEGYNFGSIEAAKLRWRAALKAGVNLIATDQYEDLAQFMQSSASN
ncbi:MAG TPA: hypothetical protein VG273_10775 [Bryobacteraceae bacterium]|nr:hypothetical protein [Bryobacteraceae bacterium]